MTHQSNPELLNTVLQLLTEDPNPHIRKRTAVLAGLGRQNGAEGMPPGVFGGELGPPNPWI
jgi:hypothetical protein